MAIKHLNNFYSYKSIPTAFRFEGKRRDIQTASLEQQVQAELTRGHHEFFLGRYQVALQAYQAAYAQINRFLHPDFPNGVVTHNPELVRGLALSDSFLAASTEVARFRAAAGANTNLVAPVNPPRRVTDIVERFGTAGTTTLSSAAQNHYRQATNYLQMGAFAQAQNSINRAAEANNEKDLRLQADLTLVQGIVFMHRHVGQLNEQTLAAAQSPLGQARNAFQQAARAYAELGVGSGVAAANNNLGVLHTLTGNAKDAGTAFQAAGDSLPVDLGRTMIQQLNPGTATTMVRPMGTQGLGLLVRAEELNQNYVSIPVAGEATAVDARRLGVLVGSEVVSVNLAGDSVTELRQKIFEPRIIATTLESLRTYEDLPFNFVAHLAHIQGFTIPMSFGDCYLEMGEFDVALEWYQKARDYQFLNRSIEAPVVWLKMGNTLLRFGHFLLKSGDKPEAKRQYEKIVRLTAPELDPASPLYVSPVFDDLKAQVQAILTAPQPLNPETHNPAIAAVLLLAQLNLQNIAAGIDLPLLSLEREQVPVFTFQYLQNVARYFADHAIQAERTYISFKTSAEQEEFTRTMLENAVDLERANEALEQKREQIARDQKAATDANLAYADKQLENARDSKEEFKTVSLQQMALESEITYVGAPTTEYDFSGYGQYGISDGEHRVDEVIRTLTARRSELSRELELHNMDRRISELNAARAVAQAQQVTAQHQVEAALLQGQIATLRRQQAQQQLAQFDSEEFTPDLWNRLANEIRAISESYLEQAIIIAQLMEQSFEFEIGEPVDIIKPSYTRNDLSGLLAADFLLQDIDSFTFLRITLGQKKQPMKEVISLADRYPLQFLRDFQQTGVMSFRTELSDFDRNYPGAYQQRIKRVEVAVEGLIGRQGIHGTLTNTGLCLTRTRSGAIRMRMLKPETLLLSQYRIGPDSIVFTPDQEMLAVFENSPVSTSWVLEIPPSVNDLIYNFISDVKLIIYYESFFDEDLKPLVLEELALTQPLNGRRTVALRYELFDEFFSFQDTGELRFTLRSTMLPFFHTNPRIGEMSILVQTDEGVSPAGLVAQVTAADGTSVTQTTDADGAISTGVGSPLNALLGHAWLQEWTISVPQAPNQARFDAGFRLSQVTNIVLVTEYEFTPRRIPGEPFLLLRDAFAASSLADFDVVDDPQASQNPPSNWVHNAAEGRIEQHSNIFGGPGGADAIGPNKPGAYLVRKATATVPAVRDFLLTCNVRSEDDDGIGVVFRYQDVGNFYFFIMDNQRHYRRLGKKVAGMFQELSPAAFDDEEGYVVGQVYNVRVRARGDRLEVFLDDELVLSGQDSSLPNAGRVGFYSWGNLNAQFDDLQIIEI
jgi:tetratricopeptide (TPR) repeat protein